MGKVIVTGLVESDAREGIERAAPRVEGAGSITKLLEQFGKQLYEQTSDGKTEEMQLKVSLVPISK